MHQKGHLTYCHLCSRDSPVPWCNSLRRTSPCGRRVNRSRRGCRAGLDREYSRRVVERCWSQEALGLWSPPLLDEVIIISIIIIILTIVICISYFSLSYLLFLLLLVWKCLKMACWAYGKGDSIQEALFWGQYCCAKWGAGSPGIESPAACQTYFPLGCLHHSWPQTPAKSVSGWKMMEMRNFVCEDGRRLGIVFV